VNAAGIKWKDKFGFGLLDADAAITLASSWTPVPPEVNITSDPLSGVISSSSSPSLSLSPSALRISKQFTV